jgi:hypothetical protein
VKTSTILPVSYVREAMSLVLRAKHRQTTFDKRVLRKIFEDHTRSKTNVEKTTNINTNFVIYSRLLGSSN